MRKKTLRLKRRAALFLAAAMMASGGGVIFGGGTGMGQIEVWGAPEEETTGREEIAIRTTEDFLAFSRSCVTEGYSKGKRFVLEADLNLQGVEFQPIPVFAGSFDGGGHGIIGVSIDDTGSDLGIFRYVQEGAQVKNLRVHGTLCPQGSRKNIGGIAGVNRGLVENCTFTGQITAQEALGGIAGYNGKTGVIRDCENQAVLTGNLKTGGIAGYNEGLIENCANKGEINATDQENKEDGGQIQFSTIDLEENLRVERVNDAGGIAGLSLGIIRNCTNHGTVGYPHVGYNLGGIAGRQSGRIDGSVNYGRVQGRKDVGGITGQFEPYLTVKYEEDMFQSLENQMDELSGMGDSMSRLIEEAGDTATGNLDRIDDQLGRIREIGRFYKDLYKEDGNQFEREADQSLDEIQRLLDHMDLELATGETGIRYRSAQETMKQMKKLREEMKKGYDGDLGDAQALKEWLEQRRRQLEQMAEYGESLQADLNYLAVHGPKDAAAGVEEFGDDLENLQVETNSLLDVIRMNRDRIKNDMETMDDELTSELDVLYGDMDALTDNLKDSRARIRNQRDEIQNQIDEIRSTVADGVDRAREDRDLFEDVSDTEIGELEDGVISGCVNQGYVRADYQAGGIVGIIGMETSLDPEQDLEADEERSLNATRNLRAIVSGCINRQQVEVKNDYAGGIAGKANLGALVRNQNYGDIRTEDGNYAGGITGSSAYVLRGNYNMCTIGANDYAGGIAGWGTDILDNYSMVSFTGDVGECIGTVAGNVDEEGIIEGNLYVEEGIGAVDGITFEGQAEGLAYEAFWNLEEVPEEFGRLSVEFLVEDEILKTVYCQYGGSVADSQIPQVPKKDGYYYVWEKKDLSCIRGNEKVRAIYRAWNTTIASSQDKMPIMLAESDFYPGTSLILEEKAPESLKAVTLEGYEAARVCAYSVVQPEGAPLHQGIRVHVLAEGCPRDSAVGIVENGQIRIADSRWDGSYLVFDMEKPGEIVILRPKKGLMAWLAAGGAVFILAALWIAAVHGKKKKKAAPAMETETEEREDRKIEGEEKKGTEEPEKKAEEKMGEGSDGENRESVEGSK